MTRIQHVTVTVPSTDLLDRVGAFYEILRGVPLVRPPALAADTPGAWFGFGDTQLHLIVGNPVAPPAHFAVDLGEAYDRVLEELKQAGHPWRTARDLWGGRRCFVEDPAGNRLEVFDRPPESRPL